MNLRKIFNCPSNKEKKIIIEQCKKLCAMANEESSKHMKIEHNYQDINDKRCPNCKGTVIVNKIAQVIGEGHVSGSFFLGNGGISGSSHTDTNEVNHCSNCGNQWKKYEINYKWENEILADWMNDIDTHREGKYDFADKTIVLLKNNNIYAETIKNVLNNIWYNNALYYSTKDNLTLSYLRCVFGSVYDKK